jgi:hypothetical protein
LACCEAGEGPERSVIPVDFEFEFESEFEEVLRVSVVRCTIYEPEVPTDPRVEISQNSLREEKHPWEGGSTWSPSLLERR